MLRSWNRQIRISLFANTATLELVRRWPQRVLASQQLAIDSPELTVVVSWIKAMLKELKWTGGISLTVGNRWFRFAELPWALQSGNDRYDTEVASSWLTQSLKADNPNSEASGGTTGWSIILNCARHGQPRLFAALPLEKFNALAQLDQPAHPLECWQPWVALAWNHNSSQLPNGSGVVGIAEPGMLSLVSFSSGRVQAITQRTLPLDSFDGLLSQLRLEELRLGKPLDLIADALPTSWQPVLATVSKVIAPCRSSTLSPTTAPSPQATS